MGWQSILHIRAEPGVGGGGGEDERWGRLRRPSLVDITVLKNLDI